MPAGKLNEVRGWRPSFSSVSPSQLAHLLQPHPVAFKGEPISRSASALRLWVQTKAPYPATVTLWFQLPGEDTRSVRIGTVAPGNWKLLDYSLPAELRGSRLVGIDLDPVTENFGPTGYHGTIWLGPLQQRVAGRWLSTSALQGWVTPTDSFDNRGRIAQVTLSSGPVRTALRYERNGTSLPLLRPDAHLPDPIPVLASPAVAAAAVNGVTTLELPGSSPLSIRVVATTKLFPTITDTARFVVADYGTMYDALNEVFPGIAPPTEAWFFDSQSPSFASRLARPPFRLERLIGARQAEAALRSDPLASGTRSVLLATAVVAALLAVIGLLIAVRSALRDEAPILAEYEALGMAPSLLARSTGLRLMLLAAIGVAAGAAGGLLATHLVALLVAVTGGGAKPVPPIATTIAWGGTLIVLAAITAAAALAVVALTGRAFGRPVAERLRA